MNYQDLIEKLRTESLYKDKATLEIMDLCMDAARAIIELADRAIVLEQQLKGVFGDIERIRAEYGIDNADADEALAELCENYCANAGKLCYLEGEDHTCKNFKCQTRGRDIYFDRLFELIQADREGRCVVLPPDDFAWTVRGDIMRDLIRCNCQSYKSKARGEQNG